MTRESDVNKRRHFKLIFLSVLRSVRKNVELRKRIGQSNTKREEVDKKVERVKEKRERRERE